MSTTGHESDIITVSGLKSSLQKFKTDHVNGKVSNVSFDSTSGKIQKTINGTTSDVVQVYTKGEVYAKAETYTKAEVNSLVSTPHQNYVTVEATSSTTSVNSLLPTTGSADTIYRVGKWNGTQYDTTVYTEYGWNGSAYVPLETKSVGIDNTPTSGSNNFVKSDGIYKFLLPELKRIATVLDVANTRTSESSKKIIAQDGSIATASYSSQLVEEFSVESGEVYIISNVSCAVDRSLDYVIKDSEDNVVETGTYLLANTIGSDKLIVIPSNGVKLFCLSRSTNKAIFYKLDTWNDIVDLQNRLKINIPLEHGTGSTSVTLTKTVDCVEGWEVFIKTLQRSIYGTIMYFYDSKGAELLKVNCLYGNNSMDIWQSVIAPSGTVKIKFQYKENDDNTRTEAYFVPKIESIYNNILSIRELNEEKYADIELEHGDKSATVTYEKTINILSGTKVRLYCVQFYQNSKVIIFYDAAGNELSSVTLTSGDGQMIWYEGIAPTDTVTCKLRYQENTSHNNTVAQIQVSSSYVYKNLEEIRDDIQELQTENDNIKDDIDFLEDTLDIDEERITNVEATYDKAAGEAMSSFAFSQDLVVGETYVIEYDNISVIPHTFSTVTNQGVLKQDLKPYISVGSGENYFVATESAHFVRVYNPDACAGYFKISSVRNYSKALEDIQDDIQELQASSTQYLTNKECIINSLRRMEVYHSYTYARITQNATLEFEKTVDYSKVRKYKIKPNVYLRLYGMGCIYNVSKTYFITDENGQVLKSSATYNNRETAVSEELITTPESSAYLYVSGYAASFNAKDKPYEGLKILSLGDSNTMYNNYGEFLADETGCTQRGRGQNGGVIGTFCNDGYDSGGTRVQETFDLALLSQYDIITILGGGNNYGHNTPIGTPSDSISSDTLWGQIKKVITKILTIKPDAKIIYCTAPFRPANPDYNQGKGGYEPNSAGLTVEDVMSACVRIFSYYGIPCFDYYHESGWNGFTNKVTNPELIPQSGKWGYNPFVDNIYTLDGIHIRGGEGCGGEMLGRAFGNFINQKKLLMAKTDCYITGKVTTDGTTIVPDVTKITFTHTTMSVPTTSTNEEGMYYKRLPVGTWTVAVEGYTTVTPSSITIGVDDDWTIHDFVVSN